MTTETETGTVPGGMPALLLPPPEGAPATLADVGFLADARAEARTWSPNTRRAYVAGWKDFTAGASRTSALACRQPGPTSADTWSTWWRGVKIVSKKLCRVCRSLGGLYAALTLR